MAVHSNGIKITAYSECGKFAIDKWIDFDHLDIVYSPEKMLHFEINKMRESLKEPKVLILDMNLNFETHPTP